MPDINWSLLVILFDWKVAEILKSEKPKKLQSDFVTKDETDFLESERNSVTGLKATTSGSQKSQKNSKSAIGNWTCELFKIQLKILMLRVRC